MSPITMKTTSPAIGLSSTVAEIFPKLGLSTDTNPGVFSGAWGGSGELLEKRSPIDGSLLGKVRQASPSDYDQSVAAAQKAFLGWRDLPAPKRGEVIRKFGEALRILKPELGRLVSLETGKILAEGEGEVQEMIDICEFSLGLSRQLYGLTVASERPGHRMFEQWQPLGVVGIISAFNFPVAVWAWNSVVAATCGNATLWKPSEKTPLTAIATIKIAERVCRTCGVDPAIFSLAIADGPSLGKRMAEDRRIPLISATGSTAMGRFVGETVAKRLGRTLLELGGNNAVIVAPSADLNLAERAILFGAVGTAGQRCTTTRRLIIHEKIKDAFISRLVHHYEKLAIGNPLESGILAGPLIDAAAGVRMQVALNRAKEDGGKLLVGGDRLEIPGCYVRPAIVDMPQQASVVCEETFAPILYVLTYRDLDEAISLHNAVPQGLSSAIFTTDLRESERFLSALGSDCGIANVNIGTSGAEIGGAFGGEKDTGGGRESGSDSWKAYMRRQTVTINFSSELPLAQGIRFE